MSNKLFTKEEVKILSKNKYVKNVSNKAITYTDELKVFLLQSMKKENFQEKYLKSLDLI